MESKDLFISFLLVFLKIKTFNFTGALIFL